MSITREQADRAKLMWERAWKQSPKKIDFLSSAISMMLDALVEPTQNPEPSDFGEPEVGDTVEFVRNSSIFRSWIEAIGRGRAYTVDGQSISVARCKIISRATLRVGDVIQDRKNPNNVRRLQKGDPVLDFDRWYLHWKLIYREPRA